MPEDGWRRVKRWWLDELEPVHRWLTIIGAFGLVALIAVPWLGWDGVIGGHIAMAIGDAALVVAVLGLTVEPLARKAATVTAIDTAMKEAARYVLTHDLPEEAAGAIKYISGRKLIRRDFTLRYRFQRSEQPGKVTVRPQLSYKMENCTTAEETFHFVLRLTRTTAQYGGTELVWIRGQDVRNIKLREFEDEDEVREEFKIPPNKGRPRNLFVVRTVHTMPASHEEVFYHRECTLGARVIIEVEDGLDLNVGVSIGTFHEDRIEEPDPNAGFPMEWSLDGTLLLPGQAISVEWNLREDETEDENAAPKALASEAASAG